MNLNEANKILKNAGYIIEGSMSLKDKMANAEKQLTYIKLKDVADLLGISQSYISRIEKKVIKRLRNLVRC